MSILRFTLTRHEIACLADLTFEDGLDPIQIEQRSTGSWTITRAVLPNGETRHLGYAQDAPKWLVQTSGEA